MTFTCTGFRRPRPKKLKRNPIRERRSKWVNGRIKRYGPSRAVRWRLAFGRALARHVMPLLSDARNNSSALWGMLSRTPRPPVTGKFIVVPVNGGRTVKP